MANNHRDLTQNLIEHKEGDTLSIRQRLVNAFNRTVNGNNITGRTLKLMVNGANAAGPALNFRILAHTVPTFGRRIDPTIAAVATVGTVAGVGEQVVKQYFMLPESHWFTRSSNAFGKFKNVISAYVFPFIFADNMMATIKLSGKGTKKEVDVSLVEFTTVSSLLVVLPITRLAIDWKIAEPAEEKNYPRLAVCKDGLQYFDSWSTVAFFLESLEDIFKIPRNGNDIEIAIRYFMILSLGYFIAKHANSARHKIRDGQNEAESHKPAHDFINDTVSAAGLSVNLAKIIMVAGCPWEWILLTLLAAGCLAIGASCESQPETLEIEEVSSENAGSYSSSPAPLSSIRIDRVSVSQHSAPVAVAAEATRDLAAQAQVIEAPVQIVIDEAKSSAPAVVTATPVVVAQAAPREVAAAVAGSCARLSIFAVANSSATGVVAAASGNDNLNPSASPSHS